jgi:hypothetical protein
VQDEGGRKHPRIVEKQVPDTYTTASAQKVLSFCNQEDLSTFAHSLQLTTCIIRRKRGKASRNSGKAS